MKIVIKVNPRLTRTVSFVIGWCPLAAVCRSTSYEVNGHRRWIWVCGVLEPWCSDETSAVQGDTVHGIDHVLNTCNGPLCTYTSPCTWYLIQIELACSKAKLCNIGSKNTGICLSAKWLRQLNLVAVAQVTSSVIARMWDNLSERTVGRAASCQVIKCVRNLKALEVKRMRWRQLEIGTRNLETPSWIALWVYL